MLLILFWRNWVINGGGYCHFLMLKMNKSVYNQIENLKEELKILRMLLLLVGNLSDAYDQDGVNQLGSLVLDLETTFKEAKKDFRVSFGKGYALSDMYL
ncbi:hypothetical protein ACH5RR_029583 [Cinchona calisaya]|uniref:Uncharacterized protein n=1 Tax=Cinchona calisaya TaxID=153742 RepID=A0ABD2YWH7_9GENT